MIFLREGDKEFEKVQNIVRGKRKLLLKIIPENLELLDYDFANKGYSRLKRKRKPKSQRKLKKKNLTKRKN